MLVMVQKKLYADTLSSRVYYLLVNQLTVVKAEDNSSAASDPAFSN